jgi:integrase
VEERKAVLRARDLGVPLWAAVEAFARSSEARGKSVMVPELVARRRAALEREALSPRYLLEMESFLKAVEAFWPERSLSEVTTEEAENFVFSGGTGARVLRKRKVLLGGLFAYAERLGLMERNPARRVRTPVVNATRISLLSPEESRRYLLAVASAVPRLLPAEAIRMFAGLRRAEVERLDWSQVWVARRLIEVGAAKSKTRMRRLIDIEPPLHGVLEATARESGPVVPPNYKELLYDVQRAGGWRDDHGSTWPENCLRHGFVSYHLALYHDAARTELQAGHERATMFRNYRELVTEEEAAEFWTMAIFLPSDSRAIVPWGFWEGKNVEH